MWVCAWERGYGSPYVGQSKPLGEWAVKKATRPWTIMVAQMAQAEPRWFTQSAPSYMRFTRHQTRHRTTKNRKETKTIRLHQGNNSPQPHRHHRHHRHHHHHHHQLNTPEYDGFAPRETMFFPNDKTNDWASAPARHAQRENTRRLGVVFNSSLFLSGAGWINIQV